MRKQSTWKELSIKNENKLSKHRRLELEHFCYQYKEWKKYLKDITFKGTQDEWSDPTAEEAIKRVIYEDNIKLVEDCCKAADETIWQYLLIAVTDEDISYEGLLNRGLPCGRRYFYERLRRVYSIMSVRKINIA